MACFPTTGCEWEPHNARTDVRIVASDTARTADIPPTTQEINCKSAHPISQTSGLTWYKQSVEKLLSQNEVWYCRSYEVSG